MTMTIRNKQSRVHLLLTLLGNENLRHHKAIGNDYLYYKNGDYIRARHIKVFSNVSHLYEKRLRLESISPQPLRINLGHKAPQAYLETNPHRIKGFYYNQETIFFAIKLLYMGVEYKIGFTAKRLFKSKEVPLYTKEVLRR